MNGTELLAKFKATRDEAAFREVVGRHTNFVYSIAKRRVANVTLAEEVAQIVFIRLAKAPPKLESEGQLLAWLHRTTVHVSIDLWRSEIRRRAREQEAVAMQTDRTEEVAWNELKPVLDEALDKLTGVDREVILLRFFEQKTMADLGRAFGVSEDAAKMRVSRALEKLRTQVGSLGARCTTMLLGTLLFERSVEAAPKGLATTLAAIKLSAPIGLLGAFVNLLLQLPGLKIVSGLLAAALLGGAVFLFIRSSKQNLGHTAPWRAANSPNQAAQSNATRSGASWEVSNSTIEESNPDPIKLLQGVARARQRIASGIITFDMFTTHPDATNSLQLKIQFEDGRCWVESVGQEYRYVTPIPGGPEAEAIVKRADAMPHDEAVRAGLLQGFPSRHVAFYQNEAVSDYWETDSAQASATIDKPGRSSIFIFDPRCLGISSSLYVESKVQNCLAYPQAKSVTLVGKESWEGNPVWHVKVRSKQDSLFDWWLDVSCPTRVLKLEVLGNVTVSRYSDTDLKDALPIEVRNTNYRNGAPRYETRIIRRSTQYDVPIDPSCWTLDGLHMKVGTPVIDVRIHRSLGYWNGAGLSDLPQFEKKSEPVIQNRAELLTMLENEPGSAAGFEAAQWILLNSPNGPDVEKAADAILKNHIENPGLAKLTQELERMRHNSSSNLLQAMLDHNPSPEVRGKACLALATLRKDAAEYGKNKQATTEAEKFYEKVIREFEQIKLRGYSLAELAKPELSELRQLIIGKVAPDIEGYDLNDQPMKLSDYRGRVVALIFWSALSPIEYEAREYRRLAEQFEGRPFILLGVPSYDRIEQARAAAAENHMNWRSFQDPRSGPIQTKYNIKSWPTIFVLDRKGVIRCRGLYHRGDIAAAVDKLLTE